jgi:WD40 repeat protein
VRFVGDTMHLLVATRGSLLLQRRQPDGTGSTLGAVARPESSTTMILGANGRAVGLLAKGAARVWRARDTTMTLEVVPTTAYPGQELYISRDGSKVLTVPDYDFAAPRLWGALDGKAIDTLPHSGASLFAFSERGDYVISAQPDLQLRAYPLTSAGKPLTLHGACCELTSIAYDRTGDMVVASDTRGGVNVWAPKLRPGLLYLSTDSTAVRSTEFSRDGKRVVAGYNDGTVRIWTIDPGLLIKRIRSYTRACVPTRMRMERLSESANDAKERFEACQQKFHGKHTKAK